MEVLYIFYQMMSLKNNFILEARSKCTNYKYMTKDEIKEEKQLLKDSDNIYTDSNLKSFYKEIESRIRNRKRDGFYKFMGYRAFQHKTIGRPKKDKTTNEILKDEYGKEIMDIQKPQIENLDNSILIIDEAHNITDNKQGEAIRYIMSISKNMISIINCYSYVS